jgi:surface antigen
MASDGDQTGSITPPPGTKEVDHLPPEGDLAFARIAAGEVLSRGGKGASLPWENPATGARGTVTPIASAYTQDGMTCRDFLASYVSASVQSWMQGAACKQQKGAWEVRSLKPWKRS